MSRQQELLAAFRQIRRYLGSRNTTSSSSSIASRNAASSSSTSRKRASCSPTATPHFTMFASSSERMRLIELFELQHDEGPCFKACRTGHRGAHQSDR